MGIRPAAAAVTLSPRFAAAETPTKHEEAARLLRLFTPTFPGGRAGAGLLLLRAALGSTAVIKGGAHLSGQDGAQLVPLMVGFLAVVGGTSLLIGCLTPLACILSGSCSALLTNTESLSAVPLGDGLSLLLVPCVSAAVVLLGPGAFSLDARLFGRREIIIPQAPRAQRF